jgi:hypothetical protein
MTTTSARTVPIIYSHDYYEVFQERAAPFAQVNVNLRVHNQRVNASDCEMAPTSNPLQNFHCGAQALSVASGIARRHRL